MAPAFLDSNVILRHLLGDHQEQSPRATAYLQRVENREVQVHTAETVIFEVVFTLQRHCRLPKSTIRDAVLPLIELPGVILAGKRRIRRAFDIYVDLNVSFADAYHAVLMQQLKLDTIITFDKEFDRIAAIQRLEP